MIAALEHGVVGAELWRFLPTTLGERAKKLVAPPEEHVVRNVGGVLQVRTTSKVNQFQNALQVMAAIENILAVRSRVLPNTRPSNVQAWVKFRDLLLDHPHAYYKIAGAFETTRAHCQIKRRSDWSELPDEAQSLLFEAMLLPAPSAAAAPAKPASASAGATSTPKSDYQDLLAKCNPAGLCVKFNLGSCSESSDHKGKDNSERKHACSKCGLSNHGASTCRRTKASHPRSTSA